MEIYNSMSPITKEEAIEALVLCTRQIQSRLPAFTEKFQAASSENLFYQPVENTGWTSSFWTGEIWLAYEFSKNEAFKEAALIQCDSFYHRIKNRISTGDHDLGFLYTLSCVAAFKLTGDEKAKEAALEAAGHLMRLYSPLGKFIRTWGEEPVVPECFKMIVDCLLNIPLLYWATEVTGDDKYREAAVQHFLTTHKHVLREDGLSHQVMVFDVNTGEFLNYRTNQGYSDESAWSRGQAWAIYGPAITYKYTGMKECFDMFRRASDYFMKHLPEDMIPYFDLTFTEGDKWPRDSSASAIAACGMLEMAKYLDDEEASVYVTYAKQLMKALYDKCMVRSPEISNGLLLHGTYCCMTPFNRMKADRGVDECCSFGDYFYMEALTRLHKDWEMYW